MSQFFRQLGLESWAFEGGTYLLRAHPSKAETCTLFVGLLFRPETREDVLQFFRLEIPAPELTDRMSKAWQELDARRLEESGLVPLNFALPHPSLGAVVGHETYKRPDGVRQRHALRLSTGEVVCLN